MSTTITDALDQIETELVALLTGYTRLPFPSVIEANTEGSLRLGFAIDVGPGVNTKELASCKMVIERDVSVILTRQVYAGSLDVDTKYDAVKNILEDHLIVVKHFEQNPQLGGIVTVFDYDSDNGVEPVFADKENFIKIELNFKLKYFEDLT